MEVVRLVAQSRSQTGKGAARQLRRQGRLPAVLYGRGESVAVSVDQKDFMQVQQTGMGGNTILTFELQGEDPETCNAIVRDMQINALNDDVMHIDFYRLDMSQSIVVSVPFEFVNVPEDRLKIAGVTWRSMLREADVRCLPSDIPAQITVDLQGLEVGSAIHAGEIVLPEGVSLDDVDANAVVVTVTAIAVEASEEIESEVAPEVGGGETEASEPAASE